MSVYNDSFMNNATSVVDLINGISSQTGNPYLIGYLLLLATFIILLIVFSYKNEFKVSLVVASLITTVVAGLLSVIGMASALAMAFPITALMLAVIFLLLT